MTKTILVLASNPRGTTVLDLSREIRDIEEGLKRSQNRDQFKIEICVAVRPIDLRRAIMEIKPQIVHFCGHGEGNLGLCLENDNGNPQLVGTEALLDLFRIFANSVECVVINSCYSEVQAQAIAEHINYVVGMNRAVRDNAAIKFAVGFYDGISAGESIERSLEIGKLAVLLEIAPDSIPDRKLIPDELDKIIKENNLHEHSIPVLYKNDNLGIQVEYTDPQAYTGQIWTYIIPEANNSNKRHLITIDWGNYYWQQAMIIPREGILLLYTKRNQDLSPRIVTVAPAHKSYPDDGAAKVTEQTKINNGHLEAPQIIFQKDINEGWHKLNKAIINSPTIHNLSQLENALNQTKFCGSITKSKEDFDKANLVAKLDDGYYVYHLSHNLIGCLGELNDQVAGQHLYVTSQSKSEDFEASYDSIIITYHGAFFGRGEIFDILKQLRGG